MGCFVTIAFTVSYGILSWRMRQKREDPGKRESETMRNFSDFRINILATRNASQVSNENPPPHGAACGSGEGTGSGWACVFALPGLGYRLRQALQRGHGAARGRRVRRRDRTRSIAQFAAGVRNLTVVPRMVQRGHGTLMPKPLRCACSRIRRKKSASLGR